MLTKYLSVFFISMVPIIELRGAIPIGVGLGLPDRKSTRLNSSH